MKETKRALRRHHRERMIRRALCSYILQSFTRTEEEDAREQRIRALRWYNNLKKCSCLLCGNPRKFFNNVPPQERRLHEAACEEEAEFL